MSRRPIPYRPSCRRNVSRQPGTSATPYIRWLLGALQHPPIVSWRPQLSPTMVSIGRATSEYSTCPVVSRMVRAFFIVFAAWYRSSGFVA